MIRTEPLQIVICLPAAPRRAGKGILPTLFCALFQESPQGPFQVSRVRLHGAVEEDRLLPLDDQRREVFHVDVAQLVCVRFNIQPVKSCIRELPSNLLEPVSVFPANATPFRTQAYDQELVAGGRSFLLIAGSLLIGHFPVALSSLMIKAWMPGAR